MKMTATIGTVLLCTLVSAVMMGGLFGLQADAVEEAAASDTNGVAAVDTNPPPANTFPVSPLPPEIDPASPFGQLIRLVQAGVEKGVILAYVKQSPRFFELDADDIIYLNDLGTPPEILEAVMEHDQKLYEAGIDAGESRTNEAAEVDVEDVPPEVTINDLNDTLSPYGSWVYIEGYGRCWRPTVVRYNSSWRPYCDNGRWVYTDGGWYWLSYYSWGWATFHYGRWFQHASYGWCWWPDTVWAPSWVCWRYDSDYCGWAPLPPYTGYRSGVGIVYRGSSVGVGFHFNLSYNSFTFVSIRNFCDPYPVRYCVNRERVRYIYDRTEIDCRYDIDRERHVIVNRGLPAQHISKVTRQEITPVSIRYRSGRTAGSTGSETLDRKNRSVVVNRHSVADRSRSSTRRNETPGQGTVRRDDRRQGNEAPYAGSARASGPTENRNPSAGRSADRVAPEAPRRNPPRQERSPEVKRTPPAPKLNGTNPAPPPSSRQNRSGIKKRPHPTPPERAQRPAPSTPPAQNNQLQQNRSRRVNPPQMETARNRATPAPRVSRTRKPDVPVPAAPQQSKRDKKNESGRQAGL